MCFSLVGCSTGRLIFQELNSVVRGTAEIYAGPVGSLCRSVPPLIDVRGE